MSGTSVKEIRVRHADMTKLPDESNKNTPTRQGRGMRRVQSMGSGTVSRSASVNGLKQPSTMKKVDNAVHTLAGSGRTRSLCSNGRHIRLRIKVVEMNPTMQIAIVRLSNFFCHVPKASRRYKMMTTALRLNIISILYDVSHGNGYFSLFSRTY
jgi:hypothetical protein